MYLDLLVHGVMFVYFSSYGTPQSLHFGQITSQWTGTTLRPFGTAVEYPVVTFFYQWIVSDVFGESIKLFLGIQSKETTEVLFQISCKFWLNHVSDLVFEEFELLFRLLTVP